MGAYPNTTIDWLNQVIYVQQSDLLQTQVTPIAVYELNINDFRLQLTEMLGAPSGLPFVDTHVYYPPVTVAGVTLARVLEIINGYTITFLPDASYGVNVVGGNSNVADVTNPNNVSVRSANSAGLQDAESLQAASYNGYVTIDVINGVTGTTFPRGTQQTPVNNIFDAHDIAEARGLSRFLIKNSMTIAGQTLADGYTFFSDRNGVVVTIDPTADVTNCSFESVAVTGTLDSNNRFYQCEIFNAESLEATLTDCGLTGTLTLGGGTTELINCHSSALGSGYPSIDMGATGNSLVVRDYSGGIGIENFSDATQTAVLDMDSGRVIIAADVTDGTIAIRGLAEVEDNHTGTAVVVDHTMTQAVALAQKLLKNRRETDPVTGTQRIYDDDDVTVLFEGNIYEDVAGTTPYGTGSQKIDRADRMV